MILAKDSANSTSGYSATAKSIETLQKAHVSFVQAAEAFSRDSIGEAIFHARWSVKSSYRAWALLEHKTSRNQISIVAHSVIDMETLVDSTAALSLANEKQPATSSTKHESLNGSAFWSLVPILVRRLLFLASLLEHCGLVAEAQYYVDHASRIADAVKALSLQSQCLALLGIMALRRSKRPDALQILNASLSKASQNQKTLFHVRLYVGLHEAYALDKDWKNASSALQGAESAIEKAEAWTMTADPPIETNALEGLLENHGQTASRLKTLTIASKPQGLKAKKIVQKTNIKARKVETVSMSEPLDSHKKVGDLPFQQFRGDIKRRHAFQALLQKQIQPAVAVLLEAAKFSRGPDEAARQCIWQAQAHLSQGVTELTSNSVFCVLHESSISYPSMLQAAVQEQEEVYTQSPPAKAVRGPRGGAKVPARRGTRKSVEASAASSNFKLSFEKMKELVLQGSMQASSRSLHAMSDRLVKSLLMLSATSHASSPLGLNPTFALFSIGKDRQTELERPC